MDVFTCPECGIMLPNWEALQSHLADHARLADEEDEIWNDPQDEEDR